MAKPQLCGITHDFRGTEYPPCTRTASHIEAYCRGKDGTLFLAHPDEPARTAAPERLTTQQPGRLTAAARRALDALTDLIHDSSDPGTEALGARHELEQALLTGQQSPTDAHEAVPALLADNQHLRQQLARAEAAIERVQAAIEPYGWEHAQVPAQRIRTALAEPAAARSAATQDGQP